MLSYDVNSSISFVRKAVTLLWEDCNSVLSTVMIGKQENCKLEYELRAGDIEEVKLENRVLRGIIDGLNDTVVDLRIRVYELRKSKKRYKREKIELKNKLELEMAEVNYLTKMKSAPNFGDPLVVRKIAKLEKMNREIAAKYEKLIIGAKSTSKMSSNFDVLVKIEPENDNLIRKEEITTVSPIEIPPLEFSVNNIVMGCKLIELFRIWSSLSHNNYKNVGEKIGDNKIALREILPKTFCTIDDEKESIMVKERGIGTEKSSEFIESYSQTIGDIEGNKVAFFIGKIDFEVLVKSAKMMGKTSSDSSTQTLIKNFEDRGVNGSKNVHDYDGDDDDDDGSKDKKIISYPKINNSLSCSNRRVRFNPDVKCCLIDEIDVKTRSFMKRTKFIQGAYDYLLKKKLLNNNNNNNSNNYNYIPLGIAQLLISYNKDSIFYSYESSRIGD